MADYLAGVTVDEICSSHDVKLTRLYRVLADHKVPRRKPTKQHRVDPVIREQIALAYRRGDLVRDIAHRYGVSSATVSNIGAEDGRLRWPDRTREQLVELIVRWATGERISSKEHDAIARVGVVNAPGLAAFSQLVDELRTEVARALIDTIPALLRSPPEVPTTAVESSAARRLEFG